MSVFLSGVEYCVTEVTGTQAQITHGLKVTDQVPSPSFRWPLDTVRVPNEYSLRPFDGAATVKNGRVSRLSGVIPASGAPFAITVAILRWGVAWGV